MFNTLKKILGIKPKQPKRWISEELLSKTYEVYPENQYYITVNLKDGKEIPLRDATYTEENVATLNFYFIDKNGKRSTHANARYYMVGNEANYLLLTIPKDRLNEQFCNQDLYPDTENCDEEELFRIRHQVHEMLIANFGNVSNKFMQDENMFPINMSKRWERAKLLTLLQAMSTSSIEAVITFNLNDATIDQLRKFADEMEIANLTENEYNAALDE